MSATFWVTSVGESRPDEEKPTPSWPYVFCPQHFSKPAAVSAQVWAYPADTAEIAPEIVRETAVDLNIWEPSPSWPASFWPQHHTWFVRDTAHACCDPHDRDIVSKFGGRPRTWVGNGLFSPTESSPTWPKAFKPQQNTFPSAAAQECQPPALTNDTAAMATSTGARTHFTSSPLFLQSVDTPPFPTCPSWLRPQQRSSPALKMAQLCCPPRAKLFTCTLDRPGTAEATGTQGNDKGCCPDLASVHVCDVALFCPACPTELLPQQRLPPSFRTAQEWSETLAPA